MSEHNRENTDSPAVTSGSNNASWLRRNLRWVLPLGLVGGLIFSIAIIALALWVYFFAGAGSEVYSLALKRVQNNPQVTALLGTPVKGVYEIGAIGSSDGEAEGVFTIVGPKGKAQVECAAFREDGKWVMNVLTVQPVAGGELIDLADDNL